ncbi:DUF87 domain-containing protein [Mesorhizobium sp. B2-4-6]|uniref:helicase HerA domain-containing protein n=1 Tax=Mesorhizobium sp. B2-4-6 TaxID=2589943 RepID=UPI00112685A2|nr:DUF87 domain-containing protein [Mesorhizobium sp. B2-4-6]TPL40638.1 DUF87 domain-containing protein [Mesorhizobium sp. B2-4-6]
MDIAPFLDKPTAIVGTTGAGKTFAAKGAVERLLDLGRRVLIIDPTGAWYGLRAGADGSAEGGYQVLIFGGDHADIPISPDAGEAVAEALAGRDVQAIIDTSEMTGGEKTKFLTAFLQKLYALNKAALHLVVDEADEICPQNPMPEERRLSGAFDKIVRRGRIKGFRPLMITQRPAVLHKNVLSQIGTLIALKLTSPQDRKAIEDWVKGNADAGQARTVMSSLPTLARGEGWVWSPADAVLERVTFPPIRTFDSSRTPDAGEAAVAPALTAVDVDALREAMKVAPAPETRQAPASGASKAEIEGWEQRGYRRGLKDGYTQGVADGQAELLARMKRVLNSVLDNELVVTSPEAVAIPTPAAASPDKQLKRPETKPPKTEASIGAERKPLAVLVAAYPAGYTEPQWASLAGFKRTGGTWSTYKSRLRTRYLVEERGGLWYATTAGVEAIGFAPPEMPATPEAGLAMWKSKLPGVGPMLDVLSRMYPDAISREGLAASLGLAVGGGTFGTYLSRIRTNGLVEEPQRGLLRLSPIIMGDR